MLALAHYLNLTLPHHYSSPNVGTQSRSEESQRQRRVNLSVFQAKQYLQKRLVFYIYNNNNNSGVLFSAQVHHAVRLMALNHYYLWSLGLKSFLKPSQVPGEYTACAAKSVAH